MPARRSILLIFCAYCFSSNVCAQYKFDKPILISKDNGLSGNDVGPVTKTEDGFLWIGTGRGLCRFDGQSVKIYQAGPDLQHSPIDNFINALIPAGHFLWIGTTQGISVLDIRTNIFRHYQFEGYKKADTIKRRFEQGIPVLFQDRSGTIWIGTRERGLACYDPKKDDFRFFFFSREKYPRLNPALGSDYSILGIEQSRTNDSIIWAGTPGGLQEVNRYTGEVRLYTFPQKNKDYQIAVNVFRRMYQHDDGLLYVGNWAAGMNVFDPVAKTYAPLLIKSETGKRMLDAPIADIRRKSDHELWITSARGLAIYDTRLNDVTWWKFNDPNKDEAYGISFVDEANRVWYQTIYGIQCFDPAVQQFSRYSYKNLSNVNWAYSFYIIPDKTGNNITVCPRQTDGIYHFNRATREWTKTIFPNNESFKKESEAIRGFVQLPSGDYLISADKGIYQFSQRSMKMTPLQPKLPFPISRKGQLINGDSGYVWMPYYYMNDIGLVKWKPGTRDYTLYKMQIQANDSSRGFPWAGRLFRDSRKNVWFATSEGLGVYDASRNTIVNLAYSRQPSNSLLSIGSFAEDRNGRVWASGSDAWLGYGLSNDPSRGLVYKVNGREKGLTANVTELATDNTGQVWGYTLNEMMKIDPSDLSFRTYSLQYGVGEADFYHFSFLATGEIIFGGRNDIVLANPAELKRNREIPVPYIDKVDVLNQPIELANSSVLNLGYKKNFFSIGFSAIAFTMAKDVKFRYRLKGFEDWSEPTRRKFASYTNVPGGDYVFQLQAANNEGVWNSQILELPVHITTPFWVTWWFRLLGVVLVLVAAYSLYQYRVRLIKRKQQVKSEYEKKLANVEMTALLAQMNPHFLFNSLNSIDSYIIRNESKKASEYLNNFAKLMRLILQNSRSNYIALKDELVALELYLQMESLRFKNKFCYVIDVDEELDTCATLIPPMLIQPYVENAIWHGLMTKTDGDCGKVELAIRKQKDNLVCTISDNGIGRKKAAELKEKKSKNHKRSMGMQITNDRIEIINKLYNLNTSVKVIDMENENGESLGTRVELTIPI